VWHAGKERNVLRPHALDNVPDVGLVVVDSLDCGNQAS